MRSERFISDVPIAEAEKVGALYERQFGNLDEICLPEFMCDARFVALMKRALETGQAVTRAEIDAAIPGIAWEE